MVPPALPPNEELRITELASYNLQNPDTEEDFDQLSSLVAQFFGCPVALISVIDSNRQWFKGKTGTTETGNSRELSFCGHALLQDEVMVVEDASNDERFSDNPFVTGDFKIRFYAGAPVLSDDGYKLGTICIFDTKKRKLPEAGRNALLLFSKQLSQLLTLRKKNILLHQRATEIISLKSETFARYMQSQETGKKEIAYNLHEDFAQGIAASLMLLQLVQAQHQHPANHLDKAIVQLKDVLANIRQLSYDISPQLPDWLLSDQQLKNFIERRSLSLPYTITLTISGNPHKYSHASTLNALRIIEQWLEQLQKKTFKGKLQISIYYQDELILVFQDDDTSTTLEQRSNDVTESMIIATAEAQGGTVALAHGDAGMSQLKISLPPGI